MKIKVKYFFIYSLFITITSLLILELLFRFQVFDFYQFEFSQLNPAACQSKSTTLVFGDSFSAYPDGYVEQLRELIPNSCFVNAAISGTGMKQHELLFKNRLNQTQPKHIIYQLYVGNDFLDLHHPTNYAKINPLKNMYWQLSEQLLILQYFNSKFAPLRTLTKLETQHIEANQFSSDWYNPRTKTNILSDPSHLENIVYLKNDAEKNYTRWKKGFSKLIEQLPDSVSLNLLLVPHCAQVNEYYLSNMKEIGAEFEEDMLSDTYPLYQQLKKDFPNVKILDPIATYRTVEKKGIRLYYANDPHLNQRGQKVLAHFIQMNLYR